MNRVNVVHKRYKRLDVSELLLSNAENTFLLNLDSHSVRRGQLSGQPLLHGDRRLIAKVSDAYVSGRLDDYLFEWNDEYELSKFNNPLQVFTHNTLILYLREAGKVVYEVWYYNSVLVEHVDSTDDGLSIEFEYETCKTVPKR